MIQLKSIYSNALFPHRPVLRTSIDQVRSVRKFHHTGHGRGRVWERSTALVLVLYFANKNNKEMSVHEIWRTILGCNSKDWLVTIKFRSLFHASRRWELTVISTINFTLSKSSLRVEHWCNLSRLWVVIIKWRMSYSSVCCLARSVTNVLAALQSFTKIAIAPINKPFNEPACFWKRKAQEGK